VFIWEPVGWSAVFTILVRPLPSQVTTFVLLSDDSIYWDSLRSVHSPVFLKIYNMSYGIV